VSGEQSNLNSFECINTTKMEISSFVTALVFTAHVTGQVGVNSVQVILIFRASLGWNYYGYFGYKRATWS
jgi:hypothetical protein